MGVNITPGVGFGAHGEGYFRLSVTAPDARLDEAMKRMRKLALRPLITTKTPRERAYLVGVLLPGATEEQVREQMAELADLARTAGAEVVGTDVQRRSRGRACALHRHGQGRRRCAR